MGIFRHCGLQRAGGEPSGVASAAPSAALASDWPLLRTCDRPLDYVPPWSSDPVPEDQKVPGTIGLGAIPTIGCPPAPPGPGEPAVRIANYQLAGSP